MKKIISRFFAMAALAALACGCNASDSEDNGLIFMWFDVEGTVVDMTGKPIKGIRVYAESADPVATDAKGKFSVRGGGLPAEMTSVKFVDEDKEENGSFRTKTVTIALEKYKEGQGWTEGYYRNKEEVIVSMSENSDVNIESGTGDAQEKAQ